MAYRGLVVMAVIGVTAALLLPRWTEWRVARLRATHVPWPEIARRTWRGRQLANHAVNVAPFGAVAAVVVPSPVSAGRWLAATTGWLLVAGLVHHGHVRSTARVLREPVSAARAARLLVATAMAQFVAAVLAWPIVAATPDRVALAVIGCVGLAVAAQQLHWLAIVRAVGLARLAPPGLPVQPVDGESLWLFDGIAPEVAVLPRSRAVVFVHPIERYADPSALRALHRRQVSQLRLPRRAWWQRILVQATMAMTLAAMVRPRLVLLPWALLLLLVIAGSTSARSSRQREASIDHGSLATGDDAAAVVRGLSTIHERSLTPVDLAGANHPSLVDRAQALGERLPFPVPPAVPASGGLAVLLPMVAYCGVVGVLLSHLL